MNISKWVYAYFLIALVSVVTVASIAARKIQEWLISLAGALSFFGLGLLSKIARFLPADPDPVRTRLEITDPGNSGIALNIIRHLEQHAGKRIKLVYGMPVELCVCVNLDPAGFAGVVKANTWHGQHVCNLVFGPPPLDSVHQTATFLQQISSCITDVVLPRYLFLERG